MTEMGEQMRLDVKQMVHHRHRDTFTRPTLSLSISNTPKEFNGLFLCCSWLERELDKENERKNRIMMMCSHSHAVMSGERKKQRTKTRNGISGLFRNLKTILHTLSLSLSRYLSGSHPHFQSLGLALVSGGMCIGSKRVCIILTGGFKGCLILSLKKTKITYHLI